MFEVTWQGPHGEWVTEEFCTDYAACNRVFDLRNNGHPEAQWRPKE